MLVLNKIRLPRETFYQLNSNRRSGNMVDVFDDVFVIRRFDFVSNCLFGYTPTLFGFALWLWDVLGDWCNVAHWEFIRTLERYGYAYVPEGCYPVWGDIGQKPPASVPKKRALTWGEIRKMFGANNWSDLEY